MARWTAEVFVDSTVGSITANVEAGTHQGAVQQIERIYGPVQQIANVREVSSRGGGSAPSGGSGCGSAILFILAAICIGVFSGGEKDTSPSETPQAAPMERVAEPYQPSTPSYANPPGPCVTVNFEPC